MGLMDTDYQLLFMDDMDGIEDDTTFLANFTSTIGRPDTWFTPFHNGAPVHPYALTPAEPDLRDMLAVPESPWDDRDDPTGDTMRALFALLDDPTVIDALTPLGTLDHPDGLAVVRARVELDDAHSDWWVPDDTDREGSLHRLTELMAQNTGTCWVAWQPADAAEITVESYTDVRPHRHWLPESGRDVPWLELTPSAGVIRGIPVCTVAGIRLADDTTEDPLH